MKTASNITDELQVKDGNPASADRKENGNHPPAAACCAKTAASCCSRNTLRDDLEKKALINRCNRVEGQIRGIRGMLEKDLYCDDILNQVAAVRSALDSISRLILERHMKSCLIDRIQAGELEVVDELLGTLQKMMK